MLDLNSHIQAVRISDSRAIYFLLGSVICQRRSETMLGIKTSKFLSLSAHASSWYAVGKGLYRLELYTFKLVLKCWGIWI